MNALRRQLLSMLRVEPRTGGFRASLTVGADLAVLPDHFRDAPILPGVCMVQAVLLAGAHANGAAELRMSRLKNAKLMRPVRPGDQIQIDADMATNVQGEIAIKAILTSGSGQRCAEISLIARAAPHEKGGAE